MISVTLPVEQTRMKEETDRISAALAQAEHEVRALRGLLKAVRDTCKHKHPAQGYNDRDGSWAAPCIYCGHTY